MTYNFLQPHLHATADAAMSFLRKQYGITQFRTEEGIVQDIGFSTTLYGVTTDFYYLCVEVSETAYSQPLDAFVLDCKNRILPVRLYVAMPKGTNDKDFKANLKRARNNGVGIIEVDADGGTVIQEALSLSLTGVRRIDPTEFPSKYRMPIGQAQSTFFNGDPAKGCSHLYDEIEGLCRSIGKKLDKNAMWQGKKKATGIDFDKDPWASVVQYTMKRIDRSAAKCPDLDNGLFNRILGITPHRNETGHKPTNQKSLIARDRQLRTRFEHATDILSDLINASRSLRV
jgi:hypothetical protein